jgi:hypothetical protein
VYCAVIVYGTVIAYCAVAASGSAANTKVSIVVLTLDVLPEEGHNTCGGRFKLGRSGCWPCQDQCECLCRPVRKELTMSLIFHFNDPCPKCGKPIMHAVIDLHPTKRDFAVHRLECGQCGRLKTQLLSLTPPKPSPEKQAKLSPEKPRKPSPGLGAQDRGAGRFRGGEFEAGGGANNF